MPPSSPLSRRRWSRSWRPWARSRPCSRGASRSPPGVWRAPIASRPSCSRSAGARSGGLGLALIRDGNGARSFETLLRYRGAAMAEFWRALRTLKALQAEQALKAEEALPVEQAPATVPALAVPPVRPAARPPLADRARPNEPERGALPRPEYILSEPPASGALHEPAAPWRPNEPESGADRAVLT